MKKKSVEKLINKIDIDNNFDKINNRINYDKYVTDANEKKIKKASPLKILAISVGSIYAALLLFIAIDYAGCSTYNKNLIKKHSEMFSVDNTSLYQLNSKEDYDEYVNKDLKFKTSFIDKVVNFFATKDAINEGPAINGGEVDWEVDWEVGWDEEMAPGDTGNGPTVEDGETSIGTNIQTQGLDEADYSKCDGKYIYSLTNDYFEIYDLNGATLVSKHLDYHYQELYVYEESIILLGYSNADIYKFDGSKMILQNSFEYLSYNTSRLYEDTLYLVTCDKLNQETETYDDLYYDGCTKGDFVYSIVKYDLENHTYDSVRNLNRGVVTLYASNNHFYLATSVYFYQKDETYANVVTKPVTVVSIFDFDLNAIGAVRIVGNVLNQFSMDEYNNYFRIVTTNTSASERERLNAISIYDLSTLERVGYLDEKIGLDRQVVKSVTFDKDTCYVVTYENTDPLYEIDLSDVTSPKIVSIYKAPGYSSYLHKFEIDGQKYLFGIGYDDDRWTRKISIYIDNGTETTQIGKDFKIADYTYNGVDLLVPYLNHLAFDNHKALFIYNDGSDLFLGFKVTTTSYYIFKIDVDAENVVSIYKQIDFETSFNHSRCYLINGKIYITGYKELYIESFR